MSFESALTVLLAFVFGSTALYVAVARRHRPTWKVGVVLLLACMEITLAYFLRAASPNLNAKIFWYKMIVVGFSISTTSFACLALQYVHVRSKLEPRLLFWLSIFPTITTALILTNEFHGWVWHPALIAQIAGATLFPTATQAGFWYWVFIAYSFFITGLGIYLLIRWIVESRGFYSRQALGVVVAALLAMLGSALDIFHVSPFAPFIASASGLVIGTITVVYALIPLRRHDVLSVSRGAVINSIDDCILVVDGDERIALVNPAAERLVERAGDNVIGRPLKEFLPTLKPLSTYPADQNSDVFLPLGGRMSAFTLRVSPVNDWSGRILCSILVFHDVTEYRQAQEKLQASEANLAEAQRISRLGSWEWDLTANRVQCSEQMFRIAGRQPLEDENPPEWFQTILPAEEMHKVTRAQSGNDNFNIEHLIQLPDGTARNVQTRIRAYRDELGRPLRLLGSVQDITERKQAEAQIYLQAAALESAVNGIVIADAEGMILWANPSFFSMTGYTLEELRARGMSVFDNGARDAGKVREIRAGIRKQRSWAGEVVNARKDGSEYVVSMTVTPVTDSMGTLTHYVSIAQDISERVKAKKQLEYLATHDSLTRLPNRLLFSDRLGHALTLCKRTGKQGAIFFLDLDDFKSINDIFSHVIGDEFLVLLGRRIRDCLRESDTVARIGGDEFAILLEDIDQFTADLVAQKVIQTLSEPANVQGNILVVTTSIGISLFPQDGDTIPVLMKNADLAMYQAKQNNKNRFEFFNQEMASKIKEQMDLLNYLRRALKNNLFQLHYQPQVDCETGMVVGVEALLRLPHPTRTWIPPGEFIPLAERTDMILLLDEWVINTACREKRKLLDAGLPEFNLSINISNHQFSQANLIPLIHNAMESSRLDPAFIELEISESSAFQNVDITIKTLKELKSLGVKIAIDDFGKGYSSLNYLANFPLDVLKIDLSFAQRIPYSPNDVGIVKGIIAIAQSLGIAVMVEGVEKKEQLDFFLENGCKFVQGNFYSPAIQQEKLAKMFRAGF